jgi:hypothetical protein
VQRIFRPVDTAKDARHGEAVEPVLSPVARASASEVPGFVA